MPFPLISRDTPFVIGALAKSKRGQTYATINSDSNSVFQLTGFDSPLLVPFAAGVFQEKGDETRINLDAVIDGQLLQVYYALDEKLETARPAEHKEQLPSTRDTQRARRTGSHEVEHARLEEGLDVQHAEGAPRRHSGRRYRGCTYHPRGGLHQGMVDGRAARRGHGVATLRPH